MKKHLNIPIFIPHLACPNDCVFCNQKKIAATETAPTISDVKEIISEAIKTLSLGGEKCEIAFFGGSFTGIDRGLMEGYLAAAAQFGDKISGIRFSTRPDYISPEIMDVLKKYPVKTIELGMQSLDDKVLEMCSRGHKSDVCAYACDLIRKEGYSLILQMMTGLPGDSYNGAVETARKVIGMHPDGVRIYPCITVKDTELERMYKAGIYTPMSLDETVKLCAELMLMFEDAGIPIIRMGLFSEQSFTDNSIVAGPYHPAFRELCENYIYRTLIDEKLSCLKHNGEVIISIAPGHLSMAIGQKKSNYKYFKEKYSLKKLVFKENSGLSNRNFLIAADNS